MTRGAVATRALARPFPWTALDSTTHAALHAHRALRTLASRHHGASIARALADVVGRRVEVRLRRVDVGSASDGAARALAGGVALALEEVDAASGAPSAPVLLEVEHELATAVVAAALRRAPPRVPVAAPSPRIAGALAAVFSAALRRTDAARPLRVASVGAASEVWLHVPHQDELLVATLTVVLGDEAFLARVATSSAALAARSSHEVDHGCDATRLASMGDVRLAVPVLLAASLASRAEIDQLAPGDAWMPGSPSLRGRRGVAGPVLLAAASSERGALADLGEDGRVVVREGSEDLSMAGDNVVVENAAEAPIVVRVEIGAVELPAREWAAVVAGDVLALAHRVADPVVLRAGGVEIARGELVEIEGEVGVRILSRVGERT